MATSYSLWLKPPPNSALARLSSRLVEAHANELATPRFVPHVTLLGGFACDNDVRRVLRRLCRPVACPARALGLTCACAAGVSQEAALALTQQLALTLRARPRPTCRTLRVESGNIYYQCVYVRMQDDSALSTWHADARAAFSAPAPPGSSFMPHLSIIYGLLTDEQKRERVAAVAAEWATLGLGDDSFAPDTLALWRTPSGLTDTWTQVAELDV